MRRLPAILAAVLLAVPLGPPLAAAGAGAGKPQRILSMNLCIDELLIHLVERSRIVAIAADSADPRFSSFAVEVAGIPVNRGRAEEVIAFQPDLVLAGPFTTPQTSDALRRLGYRVETVPLPRSFEEAGEVVRSLGSLLGEAERGEQLAAEIERSRGALGDLVEKRGERRTAAFFEPNGFTPTAGTIGDRLLAAAGLRNIAADLGRPFLSLEELIVREPNFIVLQERPGERQSQAEALLEHPAMRDLLSRSRILRLPPQAWACGGPQALEAARLLAIQAGRR